MFCLVFLKDSPKHSGNILWGDFIGAGGLCLRLFFCCADEDVDCRCADVEVVIAHFFSVFTCFIQKFCIFAVRGVYHESGASRTVLSHLINGSSAYNIDCFKVLKAVTKRTLQSVISPYCPLYILPYEISFREV